MCSCAPVFPVPPEPPTAITYQLDEGEYILRVYGNTVHCEACEIPFRIEHVGTLTIDLPSHIKIDIERAKT